MTVAARCLVETTQAANSQTTVYTATGVRTIVDKYTVSNFTGGGVTYAVNVVPSGGSASAANLVWSKTVASNTVETLAELQGHVLNPGDFISVIAGAATSLQHRVSGREISG